MEKLIYRGAEAEIYLGRWFDEKAIHKIRLPKLYRNTSLDSKIRSSRTIREASLLAHARSVGVPTPIVFFVDATAGSMVMHYVPGQTMKEIIDHRETDVTWLAEEVGINTAILHMNNIVHGDLTTSNFIVGKRVVFIDFGLAFRSNRLEDKAVDLHLIKEVLGSAHIQVSENIFNHVLKGYAKVMGDDFVKNLQKNIKSIGY